jgi:hypothetical protein
MRNITTEEEQQAYEDFCNIYLDSMYDEYCNLGKLHHITVGDSESAWEKDEGFREYCREKWEEYKEEVESDTFNPKLTNNLWRNYKNSN